MPRARLASSWRRGAPPSALSALQDAATPNLCVLHMRTSQLIGPASNREAHIRPVLHDRLKTCRGSGAPERAAIASPEGKQSRAVTFLNVYSLSLVQRATSTNEVQRLPEHVGSPHRTWAKRLRASAPAAFNIMVCFYSFALAAASAAWIRSFSVAAPPSRKSARTPTAARTG